MRYMRITSKLSMSSSTSRTAAILAGCALVLSGCGANNDTAVPEYSESTTAQTQPSVSTTTVTETVTNSEESSKTSKSKSSSESSEPEDSKDSRQKFQTDISDQLAQGLQPGDTITIDGKDAKLITVGDGFGLQLLASSPTTSDAFAREVMKKQVAGLNATDDNVRDHLQPTVEAHSEATGKTYTMQCSKDDRDLITCTGGKNAVIYMY